MIYRFLGHPKACLGKIKLNEFLLLLCFPMKPYTSKLIMEIRIWKLPKSNATVRKM